MKKALEVKEKKLKEYNRLCERILNLEEDKRKIWLGSIAATPCLDKAPAGAPDGTRTERLAEKIDKLEADIKILSAKRDSLKKTIEAAIDNLKNTNQRDVLKSIYLSGKKVSIKSLSKRLNYSTRHIRRLRERGIAELEI